MHYQSILVGPCRDRTGKNKPAEVMAAFTAAVTAPEISASHGYSGNEPFHEVFMVPAGSITAFKETMQKHNIIEPDIIFPPAPAYNG